MKTTTTTAVAALSLLTPSLAQQCAAPAQAYGNICCHGSIVGPSSVPYNPPLNSYSSFSLLPLTGSLASLARPPLPTGHYDPPSHVTAHAPIPVNTGRPAFKGATRDTPPRLAKRRIPEAISQDAASPSDDGSSKGDGKAKETHIISGSMTCYGSTETFAPATGAVDTAVPTGKVTKAAATSTAAASTSGAASTTGSASSSASSGAAARNLEAGSWVLGGLGLVILGMA